MDTAPVTAIVTSIVSVNAGRLLALASVEVNIFGVAFEVRGIQVARVRVDGREATEATLPRYRGPNGEWLAAIVMPPELYDPIGRAVLAAAVEIGVCREIAAV
jgi:stage V sporulation protein G